MNDIYNNIVLDETIFMNKYIVYKEISKEQREQLDNGRYIRLPDGGIMVSIAMRVKNGR